MKYRNIREEELKNKVAQEYFWYYDCTKIIGNVDFCVCMIQKEPIEKESLLWAEAKKGSSDIYNSLVQLILTIGKARTFDKFLPPPMLAAFDGEKIAFIQYNEIHDVFYQSDFNWNITPSDHHTKEFRLLHGMVKASIDKKALLFSFERDDKELRKFIEKNFKPTKFGLTKIKIDKNNFLSIYNKWLQAVKPTIALNWDLAKKNGIMDVDFYIADLLSYARTTLKESLYAQLKDDHYELDRKINESGLFSSSSVSFTDKQIAHTQFWNRYELPPNKDHWDYIVERRDLLLPQDIRERKGSFFTPQIWVELSQKYLTDLLGENWQDEYYVWDCAAGTGNLLAGLTNKYNIWASTLDHQDVEVIHDRIRNGANLLDDHVFQFDFLNDDFTKLPLPLQDIINDPENCKKLVLYINPPYAEASDKKTLLQNKEGKKGVEQSNTNKKYSNLLGQGNAEIFAQFFMRINKEIGGSILAEFSTLKILQGQHFSDFRKNFQASLEKIFIVPADTFDNVKGKFPIGFMIWDSSKEYAFKEITADVFDKDGNFLQKKHIIAYEEDCFINEWVKPYRANKKSANLIGKFPFKGNDFQNQNMIAIVHQDMMYNKEAGQFLIDTGNLIIAGVYFAVRHCIEATWLNDRDQFLAPNNGWENDKEFQNDCLAFTLFSNNMQSKFGTNHWIPFSEQEVNSREKFESNFMNKFIKGKLKADSTVDLFGSQNYGTTPLVFSSEAIEVMDSARELWKYYHRQPNCNVNASLYDIREHFQERNAKGKMNSKSSDETYMKLISDLRQKLRQLADKIKPKVYEYEFLKE